MRDTKIRLRPRFIFDFRPGWSLRVTFRIGPELSFHLLFSAFVRGFSEAIENNSRFRTRLSAMAGFARSGAHRQATKSAYRLIGSSPKILGISLGQEICVT
jgi:hypothetical protein